MVQRDACAAGRSRARRAGGRAVSQYRPQRQAQRTSGISAHRSAIPAACLSGRCVVSTAVITSSASPSRVERAWNTLQQVLDPEVPALSVCELGIVREVVDHGDVLEIVVTPT